MFLEAFLKTMNYVLVFFNLNRGFNPAGIDCLKINDKNTAELVQS